MKKLLATALLALALVAPTFAQTPASPPPASNQGADSPGDSSTGAQRRQQVFQRVGHLLDMAHRHPDKIDDILSKVGQNMMDKRGLDQQTVDAKLQGVYPILQQAGKMDDTTYQQQRKQLVIQILQQLRGQRQGSGS
ncbi:MAG: hypothetical protein ACYCW6_11235 [Candidatus Xenobia bacterium]